MNRTAQILSLVFAVLCVANCNAEDWYRWRGPNLSGVSSEVSWLDRWPEDGPRIAWRGSVGTGYSSFAISDGRALTMGNADETDTVFCLDATTGKGVWSHSYGSPLDDRFFAGGPTSTPTVDGSRVYSLGRQGDLFCFDAVTGKVSWSKNIAEEAEVRVTGWGFASAPLVHKNLLLLNVGEAGTAVDKMTGEIVWTSADRDSGYSSFTPFQKGDRWCAAFGSSKHYMAIDIDTGKELWRKRWLTRFGVNASEPIVVDDHVFISSGYNRGSALLKMGDAELEFVWESKELQNQMNSSVLIDGHLYGIDGDTTSETFLKCVEFMTGEVKWSQDGIGSGALMAADGKLIILSEQGELIIAKASQQGFEPTARHDVMDGKCWTVPVLSNGLIYCRNEVGDVVCVDVRKE